MKKTSGKTVKAKERAGGKARSRSGSVSAVFLVGFMGAGKTSVGRALGERLNWAFEDLDDRIERHSGRTVAEIFRDAGEAEFRRAEHKALRRVLDELGSGAVKVVALGGGAFVQEKNAALLKAARVAIVFLDASVDQLWQRCCDQARAAGTQRPLLQDRDQFLRLYETRRKSYSKASHKVQTGKRSVEAIAAGIAKQLGLKRIAVRKEQGEVE
ncbi:MAG: shikimate kinase [Candidatus Sulfotelmatobacter sp.]